MDVNKLYSILLSDRPREELLKNEEELFQLIPELRVCKGFNQNNEWHIYDVYEHILHVVDLVPCNLVLRLTALFHDIGKPNCYKEDSKGVGHFYGHWDESIRIFNNFSDKYGIDSNICNLVSNLIYYHDINIDKLDDDGMRKLYETFDISGIKMLYQIKKADLLSQNSKYHYILDSYDEQSKKVLLKYK